MMFRRHFALKNRAEYERRHTFNPEAPTDDIAYWPWDQVELCPPKPTYRIPLLLASLSLGLVIVVCFVIYAFAHDWYPADCCHGTDHGGDCHPVPCDNISETPNGYKWANMLFVGPQVRPSLDHQCHVCHGFRNGEPSDGHCIFVRPTS